MAQFRTAGPEDVPALVELRLEFMRIVKDGGLPDESAWRAELAARFEADLESGKLYSWLAAEDGAVVAASGLSPLHGDRVVRPGPGVREGLVLNMFTRPAYRRRGLAAELLSRLVAEARRRGYRRLVLQPTEEARPLYEAAGFRASGRNMELDLG